ncbi:MAG: DUF805 domain-containing protein [Phenylobacterium sp.]|uniref:DUF805 domain-containing protein n=1 Tax=Phenylobacterium sp. TaxID=1871053 RepID=UPI002733DD6B|nr:DUF805 domain-containing protein [Phenylobacterium sp.]MDP3749511.1 DUF805 domain-containing protein [Phenylobacterium sp.]
MQAFSSIGRGLSGLTRLSGRDTRAQFWSFAIFAMALPYVAMSGFVPPVLEDLLAGTPSSVEKYILVTCAGLALTVALLAAAVTRRLHDSGRSGWWGVPPLPLLALAMFGSSKLMWGSGGHAQPEVGLLFIAVFVAGALYNVTFVMLLFMLSRQGTGLANRFGPAPEPLAV